MRKILSAVLGLLMLLPLAASFTACGPQGHPKPPDVAPLRETTVKIAFRSEKPDDADNVVKAINAELLKDGRPYSVQFLFLNDTNYITEVENMAKNEGLDAAFVYIDDLSYLISRETLLNISPYLDAYGADLIAQNKPYTWAQVTNPKDGGVYAIPRDVPLADYKDTIAARKDWMDAVGIDEIDTADDVEEYFSKITNKVGIGLDSQGNPVDGFWASMGEHANTFLLREYAPGYYFPIQYYAMRPIYIDITKPNSNGSYDVKNFYESQAFRSWSQTARSFVDNGYTPLEGASSLTGHDYRFYQGLAGSLWNVVLKQAERVDEFMAMQPINSGAELYDVFLNKSQPKYVMTGADNTMGITSYSKNPNEAVDFFNWIKEEQDNYDLFCYGVEGINYFASEKTITDGDGASRLIKYISYSKGTGLEKMNIAAGKRYAIKMPYWTVTDLDFARWSTNLTDDYILSRLDWEKDDDQGNPENYVVNPLIGFMIDETVTALKNAKANVMAALVLAAEFADGRSALDEMVGEPAVTKLARLNADLNAAGIATLISEVQKQVDAFMAAKNS